MMQAKSNGFTLIELVITIVLMGLIGVMMLSVVNAPITAYFDAQRRGQLANSADVALRYLARDIRSALPNSIRVTTTGAVTYLEFIATVGGGALQDKGCE